MEALRYLPYLSDGGWIVTNAAPFVNIPNYPDHTALLDALRTQPRVILIDADALAKENSVPRAVNMVLLGAASVVLGFDAELLEAVVADFFASKGDRIVEMNRLAFRVGREAGEHQVNSAAHAK